MRVPGTPGARRRARQLGLDGRPSSVLGKGAREEFVNGGEGGRDDACVELDCAPIGGVDVVVRDICRVCKDNEGTEADYAGEGDAVGGRLVLPLVEMAG